MGCAAMYAISVFESGVGNFVLRFSKPFPKSYIFCLLNFWLPFQGIYT